MDPLAGDGTDRPRPDERLASGVGDHRELAAWIGFIRPRTRDGISQGQVHRSRVDTSLAGLALGHPDGGHLGIGEQDPRHGLPG
ncbi:MAG TPA: hypothetical protein VH279_05050 [Solirubrobacteraceae bacterium]|nr:hypothetical protein [Solirubrobacteraceae bacterium]